MFNSKSPHEKHVHQAQKLQKEFPFLWTIKQILGQSYWSSYDGFRIKVKKAEGYRFPDLLKSVPMPHDSTTDEGCTSSHVKSLIYLNKMTVFEFQTDKTWVHRIFIHHIKSLHYFEGVTEIEAQTDKTWVQCIKEQMSNDSHHLGGASIAHVIIVSQNTRDDKECAIHIYRPHKHYSFRAALGLTG